MHLIDLTYDAPDAGLFTPEEQALLQRVKDSDLWRLFAMALAEDRESLLRMPPPQTNEALNQRWGALTQLTRWLESGPTIVVHHSRMQRQEASRG